MNFLNSHRRGTQRRSNPNRTTSRSLAATNPNIVQSTHPTPHPHPPQSPPNNKTPMTLNIASSQLNPLSARDGRVGGVGVRRTTSSTNPTTPNPRQDTVPIWHQSWRRRRQKENSLHPFSVTNLFPQRQLSHTASTSSSPSATTFSVLPLLLLLILLLLPACAQSLEPFAKEIRQAIRPAAH